MDSDIVAKSENAQIDTLNLNGKQMNITGNISVTGDVDIVYWKLHVSGKLNQTGGREGSIHYYRHNIASSK